MKKHSAILLFILSIMVAVPTQAQFITGYWKGKINRRNAEVKIIKNGDSLTGTSYYYESPNKYSRFTIKGYFDSRDNSVVWWDDMLIEEKGPKKLTTGKKQPAYVSTADFNCPGGNKMYLDGQAAEKDNEEKSGPVALEKFDTHLFSDEWDYVIDNYTSGANDPELIDSIGKLAFIKMMPVAPPEIFPTASPPPVKTVTAPSRKKETTLAVTKKEPKAIPAPEPVKETVVPVPVTNEQRFSSRNKKVMQEIFISGDSVELRFYDNAEVDGDSIAIFLNNKLLYEHIRLSDNPYSIKLALAELQPTNELVMVAENLGSIPPNTSLMVAIVEGKHYEARLESTEKSSAVVKFVKQ